MNDKYYYSPENDAFYIESISPEIPPDVIEITEDEHTALLKSINEDQKRIKIVKGKITLVNREITPEETNARIRSQLDAIDAKSLRAVRSVLAAIHGGDTPDPGDIAKLTEYETQADELRAKLI